MELNYQNFAPYKYIEWVVGGRNYIMNYDLNDNPQFLGDVASIADNYEYFVKQLGNNREEFAKNVRYFQMLAAHDEKYTFLHRQLQLTGYSPDKINAGTPTIYCTYHMGSYRIINHFLITHKIPFSLVVDQNYIDMQGAQSLERMEELQMEFYGEKYFEPELLNAELRTTALEVIRRLRSGRSVLFYLDGNTGVNQFHNDPSKMVPVKFFNGDINARKGVAYLSYKSGVPVQPVYLVRHDWMRNEIIFPEPIVPDTALPADEYCQRTTSTLFKILENAVSKYPEQWEGWYYVNKFMTDKRIPSLQKQQAVADTDSTAEEETRLITFNGEVYHLQEFGKKIYLFNKKDLTLNEITSELYRVLKHLKEQAHIYGTDLQVENILVKKESFPELMDKNIVRFA